MASVLTEERDDVLLITLNRPHVLNAVDGDLTRELGSIVDNFESTQHSRVAVLTGAGAVFCAGMDIKAVAAGASIEATRHPRWGFAGITARQLSKPIIAAVNGDAVGGGFEIALACDLLVAAENARFALPEVKRGLFAAGGGVYRLAQQLPQKVALDLLLTGRFASAREMHGWGLVHTVVPAAFDSAAVVPSHDVVAQALKLANRVAANAPLAVQASKRLALAAYKVDATDRAAVEQMDREAALIFASRDASEGVAAFAEHRPPAFSGT